MATDSNGMITPSRELCLIVDNTNDLKRNVYLDLRIKIGNQKWFVKWKFDK